jgi:hypothetical protein
VPVRARGLVWRFGSWAGLAFLALGLILTTSKAQSATACKVSSARSAPHASHTPPISAAEIPIWKTITLGEYRNVNAIRSATDDCPCPIGLGDSVDEALGRPAFPFTKTKIELDLVVLSIADLGFPEDGASLLDVYNRALAIRLALCPPDLGPTLRLIYRDQPRGEFLHIAMRPVALYNGELVDFSLGNDGKRLLLVGGDGSPELVLPGAVRFIFVKPRSDTVAQGAANRNLASVPEGHRK